MKPAVHPLTDCYQETSENRWKNTPSNGFIVGNSCLHSFSHHVMATWEVGDQIKCQIFPKIIFICSWISVHIILTVYIFNARPPGGENILINNMSNSKVKPVQHGPKVLSILKITIILYCLHGSLNMNLFTIQKQQK